MMATMKRLPVVVVLGATGTGKSKLAIELGKRFDGEIISADSMQIYKGLDIITNKVTAEEQEHCRHHLISYVNPFTNMSNTVVHFRDKALPIIDRLLEEGKMPIIVGGTNYYIESLLWNFLIDKKRSGDVSGDVPESKRVKLSKAANTDEAVTKSKERVPETSPLRDDKFKDIPSTELHKQLVAVDPESAKRLHPHNRRKIIRALEVYNEHGVAMSELLKEQHSKVGDSALSGPLRYQHTCIFWIQSDKTVLDERLDKRVDGMLESGLVKELHNFHTQYRQNMADHDRTCDYTMGIFQSIGFKEFHNYLLLPEDERNTVKGKQLLNEGIEGLKLATQQYARRQMKWIRNRFLKRPGPGVPPVYGVDSTDVSQWTERVHNPACDTLSALIQGEVPTAEPLKQEGEVTQHVQNVCDVCGGRVFTTLHEWQVHMASRKHKNAVHRHSKWAANEFPKHSTSSPAETTESKINPDDS